MHVIKRPW